MGSQPQQKAKPFSPNPSARTNERPRFNGPLSGAPSPAASAASWYSNTPRFQDQPPLRNGMVTIGGQTYRELDDGRANVLVSTVSPEEQEERRRAMERIRFMANNPLGASAYGITTVAGASPQMRDSALVGGSLLDLGTQGVAFGAPRPLGPIAPPPKQPPLASLRREPLYYSSVNDAGQARTANALVEPSMLGTGTDAKKSIKPPGWLGHGNFYEQDRGHLIANQLGGLGGKLEHLVTMDRQANQKVMRGVEDSIAKRVKDGEVVELTTVPIYSQGVLAPTSILMMSNGARKALTPNSFQTQRDASHDHTEPSESPAAAGRSHLHLRWSVGADRG